MSNIWKGSKLEKDIKKDIKEGKKMLKHPPTRKTGIAEKINQLIRNFFVEVFNVWKLIVTIAQAMGAYVLLPQSALGDKAIGLILLISAVTMAVKQYTGNNNQ
jgi:hypothetical protein